MFRNTQPGSRSPFCPSTRTWTVSMAARPPGSASNSIQSSPSTAAASHDLACSSEFSSSIPSLSAVALSVTLSASSTGAAVRFSLEQPAMRSFGPASHQSPTVLPSTTAALHDFACSPAGRSRSPRSPLPVYRVALGAALSASSTGAARRSSLEQRAVQPILLSIFSFDGSSVAGPRVLVRAQPFNPSFSAASYGAERNTVIFIDSSC